MVFLSISNRGLEWTNLPTKACAFQLDVSNVFGVNMFGLRMRSFSFALVLGVVATPRSFDNKLARMCRSFSSIMKMGM